MSTSDAIQNARERHAKAVWMADPANKPVIDAFLKLPDGEAFLDIAAGYNATAAYNAAGGDPSKLKAAWNDLGFNQMQSGSFGSALGSFASAMSPVIKAGLMVGGVGALAGGGLSGLFGSSTAGGAAGGATGMGAFTAEQLAGPVMSAAYSAPAIATATGLSLSQATSIADKLLQSGITPQSLASNPSLLSQTAQSLGISDSALGSIASTGLNMLGGYVQGQSATNAAQTAANAQIEAARIAAEASKFKPVGVTTRFGQSQFGYDAAGNLTSAGYNLSPEAKAQQDRLMGMSNQMLKQYQGAPAAAAPMGQAAQTMFGLGQGYLQTSPQAQAAQYMSEQQALLAPGRERDLAQLQAQMQAQGRGGLAIGGTSTGMMAANPQLEAYYNAKHMQDLQLAAQATQGGQQYAQFGAGMVGSGGQMLQDMYGTQKAAYSPYQTALGGAVGMEQLGQNPMDIGTAIGAKTSTAAANAGELTGTGMMNAARTMQPANAYSPWGAMLSGAGNSISNYQTQQQQQQQQNFQNNLLNQLITGKV